MQIESCKNNCSKRIGAEVVGNIVQSIAKFCVRFWAGNSHTVELKVVKDWNESRIKG